MSLATWTLFPQITENSEMPLYLWLIMHLFFLNLFLICHSLIFQIVELIIYQAYYGACTGIAVDVSSFSKIIVVLSKRQATSNKKTTSQ